MDIVIRAAVIFAFIWVLMRVIGRREISSMEPFDLIMLVVIGDLVQQGVTQQDLSVTGALLAAATIGLLTVVLPGSTTASRGCDRRSGTPRGARRGR